MPNRGQIRNYNYIRQDDAKYAEAFDDLTRAHENISDQLSLDPNGAPIVPIQPAQVNVQQMNGFVDVAIVDDSPLSRAINYYLEIDTTPGFANPRTIPLGPSRNYHTILPNGTYYIQARAQYPAGGPASKPTHTALSTVITTSVIGSLTLFTSQGSGTGGGGAGKTIQRK